ncbi:hypothetical protein Q1695_006855 [Nippostrongylus brasiliensis]|nr:hypothetical protein Q1695_006855 [Nippostrongylus brasiliensis]
MKLVAWFSVFFVFALFERSLTEVDTHDQDKETIFAEIEEVQGPAVDASLRGAESLEHVKREVQEVEPEVNENAPSKGLLDTVKEKVGQAMVAVANGFGAINEKMRNFWNSFTNQAPAGQQESAKAQDMKPNA